MIAYDDHWIISIVVRVTSYASHSNLLDQLILLAQVVNRVKCLSRNMRVKAAALIQHYLKNLIPQVQLIMTKNRSKVIIMIIHHFRFIEDCAVATQLHIVVFCSMGLIQRKRMAASLFAAHLPNDI